MDSPTRTGHFGDRLIRQAGATIRDFRMLEAGNAVLVGVSGGPDSMALLHVLLRLAPGLGVLLGVAHLNHGLRGAASDADHQFVAASTRRLGLPFYGRRTDVDAYRKKERLSLEEAGRQQRYDFFFGVADQYGFDKVAVGHHREDNAELILMNLIRGSGLSGLAGIPPVRQNRIVRPLIRSSRQDIQRFIEVEKIDYVVDASNQEQRFLRNRIRHHLIPLIERAYNPKLIDALDRLTDIVQAEEAWMDGWTQAAASTCVQAVNSNQFQLKVSLSSTMPRAAQRRLVRFIVQKTKGDLRRVGFGHIEAVIALMNAGSGEGQIDLPGGVRVARSGDIIRFSRVQKPRQPASSPVVFEYTVFQNGFSPDSIRLLEINARLDFAEIEPDGFQLLDRPNPGHAYFDADKIEFPLVVRPARAGDRFTPLGASGRQKISKFFINKKIPRWERYRYPVLESAGKIVWLAGQRMDDAVKITETTRRVLKVELVFAK